MKTNVFQRIITQFQNVNLDHGLAAISPIAIILYAIILYNMFIYTRIILLSCYTVNDKVLLALYHTVW